MYVYRRGALCIAQLSSMGILLDSNTKVPHALTFIKTASRGSKLTYRICMKALKLNNCESGVSTFVSFAAGHRSIHWILFLSICFALYVVAYKIQIMCHTFFRTHLIVDYGL